MTITTNKQMLSAVYRLEAHYHGIAKIPYTDELFVEVLTYNREHDEPKPRVYSSKPRHRVEQVSDERKGRIDEEADMFLHGGSIGVIAAQAGVNYETVRSDLATARKLGIVPRGHRVQEITATADGLIFTGSKKYVAAKFGVNYRYFTGYEGTGKVTWHATGNYVFEERGQTNGL